MTGLQLTRRQYYALCTMVLLSPLLHLVPRKTTAEAGCCGWLCALVALVPLLLFAWMLEGILHRGRPGEGIGEITLRALGPVAGRVLLGVYALWFLLYSAFALRIGAERFIETVFPLSRPWPFVVTILAMAVCGALGRTKALFRASEIFLPLLTLVLVLVLVFAAPGLNVKNLLPVTVQELPGVARSGLTVFGIGAAVLFFGAFTGGRTPPAPGRVRAAVWWCVRICVLVTLLSAFSIGILGAELTAKLNHPFFTMLRNVSLFHTVERFGALVIGLWVLPDFVLVSMLLTLAVNCLRAAGTHDGAAVRAEKPARACAPVCGSGRSGRAVSGAERVRNRRAADRCRAGRKHRPAGHRHGRDVSGRPGARENLSARPPCRVSGRAVATCLVYMDCMLTGRGGRASGR